MAAKGEQAVYSHGHHDSVLRSHGQRTAENSAAYLLPYLKPKDTLLDVGCGPGSITLDLAKIVSEGSVLGIDRSADVTAQATALGKARKVDNVTFEAADLMVLPEYPQLKAGGFDVVHAHQVLQHVADPVGALKAMRAATKEGGIVAARDAVYSAFTWYPESEGLSEWLELYDKFARSNGGEPNAGRQIHAWAREAGFAAEDITKTTSAWCFSTPEERKWWSGTWAERTVKSEFARGTLSKGLATQEDLERLAQAWKDWGEAEDGWFGILHGEIIAKKVSRA